MTTRAGATIAVTVLLTGSASLGGQKFASRVEAVRVDVLVTSGGQPLRGLQAADFDVRDNGVPQQVDFAAFEQIPLNVVLALDMSASVRGTRLEHLRSAGRALLDGLTANDRAALITFGHSVAIRGALTADFGRIRSALDSAVASGETSVVDASYAGMLVGESDVGRALVIVFSDGLDTSSYLSPDAVLGTARRSDAVVYSVVVRGSGRPDFLEDRSHATGGDLPQVDATHNLSETFLAILQEFRHRYLVSYSPAGVSPDGWHRIEVRVKRRNVVVKARPGYLAGSFGQR